MEEFAVMKEETQTKRKNAIPFVFETPTKAENAAKELAKEFSVQKISAYNIGRILYVTTPKNKAIAYLVRDYISTLGGKTSW
jgi:hypothetical protein